MATVKAFRINELKLWFWSDDHEPPHFHVKKAGEWELRVSFLLSREDMIEAKWSNKKPAANVKKEISKLAESHRAALLEQWERVHLG